eukprot:TRINITY_DN933_c0_g1_i1.p1 TRINITY_DN933_c0_g1~~TRINITY_DN933_c0_g1_i1.p1  ORF type:complete len:262 (+),score=32.29 TRINITY_DN933_c0_g1_i1:47-832(+)
MAVLLKLLLVVLFVGCVVGDEDKKKKSPDMVKTIKKLVKLMRYADAQTCATKIQKLLSRDVTGIVGDLGTFSGKKLVAEYFCQARVQLPGFVSFVDGTFSIRSETIDRKARTAWMITRVDMQMNGWSVGGTFDFPLSIQLKFNEHAKLESFSIAVYHLTSILTWQSTQAGAYLASILGTAPTPADFITSYCTIINQLCTGLNKQYNDQATCETAMAAMTYFSTPLYFSNSLTCRVNHIPMATVDPALHCPHVGPSGGGACV